ncbi:MAG: hypothetical protein OGM15_12020 [Lachnospiraceae bacterium]|nr:MAG: hypothetical protein OGM15_12020 [Lachnospiraceae bacterium]
MRKYLEKMIRFFCRNKSIVLSCCIAILVGMVVLNGTVSYAEDTYGIYGVIRKSIEKNEVSSIGSKDSLNDYVAENSNGTQAVTGNSIDVSKDEKYKGPKHKGIGQNVVLSGGLSVKKSQETAKVDFFTKDSNNKKVDEDKNIVVEGSVSASKREQKDNVLSKSDCMDVSDTLSKNNIEGISKDSDNYEIVSGTVPTVSEITKDNITKASFYQRAVAIGEKSNSNYNLLNILDKDIVKDDFYTSDLLKDNSSETFDFDFLDEPGLPSTGSAVSAADGNKEFDMEIAKSADILPASASAVKFSNKNQLNINLTALKNKKVYVQYADKILFNMAETNNLKIDMPHDFYGDIAIKENLGSDNNSTLAKGRVLIDTSKPIVGVLSEDSARYEIKISENGNIISGLKFVECYMDGKKIEVSSKNMTKQVCLGYNVKVPSEYVVSLNPLEGKHTLYVRVEDNAGNITEEKREISVIKQVPVSVLTLKKFVIHIDPQKLKWKEQIYSDAVLMKNLNDYDIKATISSINVKVSKENDKYKKCKIYMVMPDTGKKILLKNGKNDKSYSFIIPHGNQNRQKYLRFVGKIYDDKYRMWKNEDIFIDMKTSYEQATK